MGSYRSVCQSEDKVYYGILSQNLIIDQILFPCKFT